MSQTLTYGTITGRFVIGVTDGPDEGIEPDIIPAQGTVVFTPRTPYSPYVTEDPYTLVRAPIRAVLDAEGYLCTPTDSDSPQRGVKLFSTDTGSVTNWTYSVKYTFNATHGITPSIPEHDISVPTGQVLDLSSLVKVPASPGIGIPQMEATALRVEDLGRTLLEGFDSTRHLAQSVVDRADAGEFKGDKGDPGGWVPSTVLAPGTSLDLVLKPGLYLSPTVNQSNNPVADSVHLEVISHNLVSILQRATPYSNPNIFFERRTADSKIWSSWIRFTASRVDNSIGRRVFTADGNSELMIHGDTGIRDITSLLPTGLVISSASNASYPFIRRENNTVTLNMYLDIVADGVSTLFTVPTGFRGIPTLSKPGTVYMANGAGSQNPTTLLTSWYLSRATGVRTGVLPINSTIIVSASWTTSDPWPTILPGISV